MLMTGENKMKITEFYSIQKFQKISEVLDLNKPLEILELKMKSGALHIRTKPCKLSGGFDILRSFKDFKEFDYFLHKLSEKLTNELIQK